jgi:hypothetical protein
MFTESANNAARYMRVTALFVFSQALLLIGEGSWMMLNHKSHVPHYHNHHVHDACHSLAYVLGALLGFYTLIILLIVLTKYARKGLNFTRPARPHHSSPLLPFNAY